MKVIAHVVRLPAERNRLPVALSVVLQVFALLALVTVVRDQRPNPAADPDGWENMGVFVEFTSIAPLAMLFTTVAVAGLHALDSSITAGDRAIECRVIIKLFAIGVAIVAFELVSYGVWKGIWQMFGAMAATAIFDLALVFLVFRYLDSEDVRGSLRPAVPAPRSK